MLYFALTCFVCCLSLFFSTLDSMRCVLTALFKLSEYIRLVNFKESLKRLESNLYLILVCHLVSITGSGQGTSMSLNTILSLPSAPCKVSVMVTIFSIGSNVPPRLTYLFIKDVVEQDESSNMIIKYFILFNDFNLAAVFFL